MQRRLADRLQAAAESKGTQNHEGMTIENEVDVSNELNRVCDRHRRPQRTIHCTLEWCMGSADAAPIARETLPFRQQHVIS